MIKTILFVLKSYEIYNMLRMKIFILCNIIHIHILFITAVLYPYGMNTVFHYESTKYLSYSV